MQEEKSRRWTKPRQGAPSQPTFSSERGRTHRPDHPSRGGHQGAQPPLTAWSGPTRPWELFFASRCFHLVKRGAYSSRGILRDLGVDLPPEEMSLPPPELRNPSAGTPDFHPYGEEGLLELRASPIELSPPKPIELSPPKLVYLLSVIPKPRPRTTLREIPSLPTEREKKRPTHRPIYGLQVKPPGIRPGKTGA